MSYARPSGFMLFSTWGAYTLPGKAGLGRVTVERLIGSNKTESGATLDIEFHFFIFWILYILRAS